MILHSKVCIKYFCIWKYLSSLWAAATRDKNMDPSLWTQLLKLCTIPTVLASSTMPFSFSLFSMLSRTPRSQLAHFTFLACKSNFACSLAEREGERECKPRVRYSKLSYPECTPMSSLKKEKIDFMLFGIWEFLN